MARQGARRPRAAALAAARALLELTTVAGAFERGAGRPFRAGWRAALLATSVGGGARVGRIRVLP